MMLLSLSLKTTTTFAFTTTSTSSSSLTFYTSRDSINHPHTHAVTRKLYSSKPPPGGIDFEVDDGETTSSTQSISSGSDSSSSGSSNSSGSSSTTMTASEKTTSVEAVATKTQNEQSSSGTNGNGNGPEPLPFQNRGKVNEVDFCMSPSDVSLSRSYETSSASASSIVSSTVSTTSTSTSASASASSSPLSDDSSNVRILSLTRALNNASNRAVRRILLSRCWPSAEALNLSLRQVLMSSKSKSSDDVKVGSDGASASDSDNVQNGDSANGEDSAKCPVPRPILNIIVGQNNDNENNNKNDENDTTSTSSTSSSTPKPLTKMKMTDEQWVSEQMNAFRETYGLLPGYEYADAYMDCILSLATSGTESERVSDVSVDLDLDSWLCLYFVPCALSTCADYIKLMCFFSFFHLECNFFVFSFSSFVHVCVCAFVCICVSVGHGRWSI